MAIYFGISALFKSAEIKITPKEETETFNGTLTAKKDSGTSDSGTNDLNFQLVTVVKEAEKTIEATSEQKVEIKARGSIIIYNNYNTEPQKLLPNTRFQTPEGLMFRINSLVTVPGIQTKAGKTLPGNLLVMVFADAPGEKYNISFKDFTIPGFKGTAKYSKIYARGKTEMTGGFIGQQKIASEKAVSEASVSIEASLKDLLLKDILSQIPENFILYSNSISYNFEPVNQTSSSTGSVIIRKKGTISAIIFDKGSLSRAILKKIKLELQNDLAKINNLSNMDFSYAEETSFDPNSSAKVTFNLKGQARLVWTFDENKLKADLLGLSKKNAEAVIASYKAVKEAWITTRPFWNQTIPNDPKKVTIINTVTP